MDGELLPVEAPLQFARALQRGALDDFADNALSPSRDEINLRDGAWRIVIAPTADEPVRRAATDLADYLRRVLHASIAVEQRPLPGDAAHQERAVVAAVRADLPGCGASLSSSKDYEIHSASNHIAVCGFDSKGVMFGLYNLKARFRLIGAPFLPRGLNTVRRSRYRVRMTLSGLGWMEWPDPYLALLPQYGIDAIFAAGYHNPDGTPAPGLRSELRRMRPEQMKDLIRRARAHGLDVYCPLVFRFEGTRKSEVELRSLVRRTVLGFPGIRGFILLTEGFYFRRWPSVAEHDAGTLRAFIAGWARAIQIVEEEAHRLDPRVEIVPWDYNIDFRPAQTTIKTLVIEAYPAAVIPMVTFETGSRIVREGAESYVKDYAITTPGPSEAAEAQIRAARKRGLPVYAKADGWTSWQFGTLPYIPCPSLWLRRYASLADAGVAGTMESWSYGFQPNFMAELRAWDAWTDAPPFEHLLAAIARREFGPGNEQLVESAWRHFSAAVELMPDTDNRLTVNSVAAPLFLSRPRRRMLTAAGVAWPTAGNVVTAAIAVALLALVGFALIRSSKDLGGAAAAAALAGPGAITMAFSPLLFAEPLLWADWVALTIYVVAAAICVWLATGQMSLTGKLTGEALVLGTGLGVSAAAEVADATWPWFSDSNGMDLHWFHLHRAASTFPALYLAGACLVGIVALAAGPGRRFQAGVIAGAAAAALAASLAVRLALPPNSGIQHSWFEPGLYSRSQFASPYWPYTRQDSVLLPDWSNRVNAAQRYAAPFPLPVFDRYLALAEDEMERGLVLYRRAASSAPQALRAGAVRELGIAEQLKRIIASERAILNFEDLRFRLVHEADPNARLRVIDMLARILQEETERTQQSLDAAMRDSRLGYEWECDYIYSPATIREKLGLLRADAAEVQRLREESPASRKGT